MTTFGTKFLGECGQLIERLDRLAKEGYDPSQIREVLSTAGGKAEVFLKSVVFPRKSARDNFVAFINELGTVGIGAAEIGQLHSLRQLYNDAKHDPVKEIDLLEAVEVMKEAKQALDAVVKAGIGNVNSVCNPHLKRVYWIAAWDHLDTGE